MRTTGVKNGLVLQGYFRVERFRGPGPSGTAAQAKTSSRPSPPPPRPELLPVKMRPAAVQPKPGRESGRAWSGAPRPELLPGMGPSRVVGPRRVAQAQSSDGVSTTPIPAGQLRVIGEGRPLEPEIRRTMEAFFQADFSGVRVHEGPAAQAMGALAFTLGDELHFAPGLYDPTTRAGVELLGHELTHVVQQRDGRVANPYGRGIAIVQDPALEAEADRMGQRVADEMWSAARVGQPAMAQHRSCARLSSFTTRLSASAVQRALVLRGRFSDHWNQGYHAGDAEYVVRNSEAIAGSIINWAAANHLADDTKIVVNYDLGGGWARYFVVVVFYHTGPHAYVNFHSCRRSNVRGDAVGEPHTRVYNTNWRDNWQ